MLTTLRSQTEMFSEVPTCMNLLLSKQSCNKIGVSKQLRYTSKGERVPRARVFKRAVQFRKSLNTTHFYFFKTVPTGRLILVRHNRMVRF